jgi:hypothetical protein
MIESILQQAPEGVTQEQVEALYNKHEGNSVAVLSELWNLPADIKNVAYNEEKDKWKNMREICQAHEEEMEKFMKAQREKAVKM